MASIVYGIGGLVHGLAHAAGSGIGAVEGAGSAVTHAATHAVVQGADTGIGAVDSAGSAVMHAMETGVRWGWFEASNLALFREFSQRFGIQSLTAGPAQVPSHSAAPVVHAAPIVVPVAPVVPAETSGPAPTSVPDPVFTSLSRVPSERSGLAVKQQAQGSARRRNSSCPGVLAETVTVGRETAALLSSASKFRSDIQAMNPTAVRADACAIWDAATSLRRDVPHLVKDVKPAFRVVASGVSHLCADAKAMDFSSASADARNMVEQLQKDTSSSRASSASAV